MCYLRLDGEYLIQIAIVFFGPDVCTGACIHQLCIYVDLLARTSYRPFQHVGHAKFQPDLPQILFATILHDAGATDHFQIGDSSEATLIDEPAAEVLRSPDTLSLGDKEEYQVRIHGVFKTNGACRIEILGQPKSKIVSGKIADLELGKPGNVYTRALNEGLVLKVVAQPTIKEGKINRLFITHAEPETKELVS